jgi:protein-L-isoaspartate(D-aspartate) O-methyltransferase
MKNKRRRMVEKIEKTYGLDSPKVLSVMLQVPREKFTGSIYRSISYDDSPVPIGYGQTMSQPYTVAFMTHLLLGNKQNVISDKVRSWRVLEIGTGSGYQAAVL